MPKELRETKEDIEALAQRQLALYGPERTRAMFDAYLGQLRK
jgi:hypothetical protein